jgi:hypothetical protein
MCSNSPRRPEPAFLCRERQVFATPESWPTHAFARGHVNLSILKQCRFTASGVRWSDGTAVTNGSDNKNKTKCCRPRCPRRIVGLLSGTSDRRSCQEEGAECVCHARVSTTGWCGKEHYVLVAEEEASTGNLGGNGKKGVGGPGRVNRGSSHSRQVCIVRTEQVYRARRARQPRRALAGW